ncbi:DUF5110 domain-containing protein [bacterium]|nr:DUF5110 domain-containing protein [bacterium]
MNFDAGQEQLHLITKNGQLNIEAITPAIFRIQFTPESQLPGSPSLVVRPEAWEKVLLKITQSDEFVLLHSTQLTLKINLHTSQITFLNQAGEVLLNEHDREFTAAEVLSEKTFHVRQKFQLTTDEGLYGLGQYQDGIMNFRDRDVLLVQANQVAVVPFLVSSRGWGLLWDNCSKSRFHDDSDGMFFWSEVGEAVDYYFVGGSCPDEAIAGYRHLTGAAPLLPKWAYGYQQSKERYVSRDDLLETVREYRNRKIPLDLIIQDWRYWGDNDHWSSMEWDETIFPKPAEMTQILHDELHTKLMVSIWPALGPKSAIFKDMQERGLLFDNDHWNGGRVYDAFSRDARKLYWDYVRQGLFENGVDAFWMDGTEPEFKSTDTPEDTENEILSCKTNTMGSWARYLNVYSLLTTSGIFQGQRETSADKRVFILTRSAFSGQQRYGAATWSGDISANWPTFRRQISAGINFSLAGIPYWTTDIGSFFPSGRGGEYPDGVADPAYRELYVRWFQFGAFCPLFRSHGTGTPREVWQFGEPGSWEYDTLVKYDQLRYRLMPYIYSAAWAVTSRAYTLMRGLVMDFPDDSIARNIADQYLFGNAFLVKPITVSMYQKQELQAAVITVEYLESPAGEPGLLGEYFLGENFETPANQKIDTVIDYNWSGGPPAGVNQNHYSIRWTGFITAPETGKFLFQTLADDGVRLWIENTLVIDNWKIQSPTRETGTLTLSGGKKYAVKLEYFNNIGGGTIRLGWQTPAMSEKKTSKEITPAHSVDVYLPAGSDWYDFWAHEKYDGGQWIQRDTPIDIMPLYVRAGAIVPLGPDLQYVDEKPADPLEIRIYSGADATFTLYEDEGDSYRYEQGKYATIDFSWNDRMRKLSISQRQGRFNGMLKTRTFSIVVIEGRGSVPAHKVEYVGLPVDVDF